MGDAVIGCKRLVKRFPLRGGWRSHAQIHAVNGVDIEVREGEIVGLVGESGCGKSTVSRVLVGIEPVTGGDVLFHGRPVTSAGDWRALRREVQYVFQDPFGSLPPKMAVGEIVADPLAIAGVRSKAERRARAGGMLERVGLSPADARRTPSGFSGGQRQRISIARALILDPKVVICDEVVSGLDVSVQAQVLNLLLDLNRDIGVGYLFISHDLRVIRYLCDRVAVMYLGTIVEEGPTAAVFERPQHPYTQGLLASVPDPATAIEGELSAQVAGEPPSLVDAPQGCPFAGRCPRAQPVCALAELPEVADGPHVVRCHFPGAEADQVKAAGPVATRSCDEP